jgi:hypothetical protein
VHSETTQRVEAQYGKPQPLKPGFGSSDHSPICCWIELEDVAIDQEGHHPQVQRDLPEIAGLPTATKGGGTQVHDVIHHSHADGSPYPDHLCPILTAAKVGNLPSRVMCFSKRFDTPLPVDFRAQPVWPAAVARRGHLCHQRARPTGWQQGEMIA